MILMVGASSGAVQGRSVETGSPIRYAVGAVGAVAGREEASKRCMF